ncbi:HAD family hydrolase [Candidatus Bathyarchaeota archaeon]|nr:HAD family hydrolase [Candidatus Bathyarchaeota archaeon]
MTIKAVIFDLDGTLASFNLDYRALRSEVRSFLLIKGIPASVLSINESIFEMLNKANIFFKNSGKSARAINKTRNEVLDIAEKHEMEAARTTGLLPGVTETLEALKKMKLKLGLCTISSQKSTEYILKRFRISKFFDAVVPRNKVKEVKPDPEHLEVVLADLGIKAEETLLVGDSGRDMRCARDVGTVAVGLPTGISTQQELANAGANYFLTSITDLPSLVEEMNRA